MSQDRLTRHEITWLLAQEARGAAKTLRDEVSGERRSSEDSETRLQPVESTLDALDDTIEMLSALNTGHRGKARRGRIDLAALLYDVAPNARIAIEPGAGTEVLGDEADLRRMLSVLVTQASAGGAETEVRIRRQGDFIKISVELGPDVATTGELERRWLSRMATRHGGRVELEGGTQSVLLQADGASDQREVTELRRELAQAQQLGEAYARELATMLASGELRSEPPPPLVARPSGERLATLRGACAALERSVRSCAEAMRGELAVALALPDAPESLQSLSRRNQALFDLATELGAIAECPLDESLVDVDLGAELSALTQAFATRTQRDGITIAAEVSNGTSIRAPRALVLLLVRMLVSHALNATPRGGSIRIDVERDERVTALTVEDGGPAIPEGIADAVVRHELDPSSVGRPSGIALLTASAIAEALGGELTLGTSARGRARTRVTLSGR